MDNQPDNDTCDWAKADKAPSIYEVMSVLDQPIRREILQYFSEGTEQEVVEANVGELVEYLSGRDSHTGQTPSDDRIALQLHHLHLPKLAETGVIEYDPNEQLVRYQGDTSLERYLNILQWD